MLKFFTRLGKHWWLVLLLVIVSVGQIACDFLIPVALGEILRIIQSTGTKVEYTRYIVGMLLLSIGSGVFATLVGALSSKITARMMSQVRYELYARISTFSSKEMNKFSTSSLITRTTNDITNITNTYSYVFRFALYGPLMAIGALVYLIALCSKNSANSQLLFLTLGAVILVAGILVALTLIALPKFKVIQRKIDKVNLITKENLEGLRVVRAYNAEEYQENKFEAVNDDLMKTSRFANRGINALIPSLQLVIGLLAVAIAWLCSKLIPAGSLTYSDMSVVNQYAMLLLLGLVLMTGIFLQLPRSIICARRINEVLHTESSINDGEGKSTVGVRGTIEFKDVSFTYPGSEVPAIEHISFKVEKGTTIAFIGATGSGKTTLINLLPRLYDTTSGEVLIDGVNVKDYKLDDLYHKFGYVPQKPYLFHDSLKNNVCLGRPNATDEEFDRALEISQSKEFVERLHGREQYEISQGGKNVSGGQRQRLSIARAIIMNPEIFIFDDSFSALDYKTDKVLRGEIKDKCREATLVIVAQRVGTIIDADQIVVLDEGKMVGIGTHKELLKSCQVYKEIALSQLSKEELEK